jgi:hypothetical protein
LSAEKPVFFWVMMTVSADARVSFSVLLLGWLQPQNRAETTAKWANMYFAFINVVQS